ncbi:MAG: cupin domain-containing protein [Janthinobacterium lividum]
MRPTSIITLEPQAGPAVAMAGGTYRVVVSGEQTGQAYAVIDMLVPPHSGPTPHAHADIQETFYVMEGEVVARSETQVFTARKGAVINIPKGGAIHNFTNESNALAHLLCIVTPAGLDKFFQEVGQPITAGQPVSPQSPTPEQQQRIGEIAQRYGQELFPPDYLTKKPA